MKHETISYKNGRLIIIDQRQLPGRLVKIEARSIKDVYYYIESLAVRGAPAIGVFAAYGLLIGIKEMKSGNKMQFLKNLAAIADYIKKSRPTAVNLAWAIDRMLDTARAHSGETIKDIKSLLKKQAVLIHKQDRAMCQKIGLNGARLFRKNDKILTYCNAGFLATGGTGTALAVIYRAARQGKNIKVYACETRPLLQGARLTSWELMNNKIDTTLICDNMAAVLMKQGKIDKIIVGADRIALNGDAANKIGTYTLAVLAKSHNIPFYIAAPSSTIDLSAKSGNQIPIEQRPDAEVKKIAGACIAPAGVKVYNPAFDVTPARLITAIITEKGITRKPFRRKLRCNS